MLDNKVFCPIVSKSFSIKSNAVPFSDGFFVCICGGFINRKNNHKAPVFIKDNSKHNEPLTICSVCGKPTSRFLDGVFVCYDCYSGYSVNYCSVCGCQQVHHYLN